MSAKGQRIQEGGLESGLVSLTLRRFPHPQAGHEMRVDVRLVLFMLLF